MKLRPQEGKRAGRTLYNTPLREPSLQAPATTVDHL